MDWNKIWEIVLTCVASAGGVAVIVLATVRFSASIVKTHLEKKIETKYEKELETYKSKLGNIVYISQAKFDKEFQLYSTLSERIHTAVYECRGLYPIWDMLPEDKDEQKAIYKERYEKAVLSFNDAQATLNANAPFISKDIYNSFNDILCDCKKVILTYSIFGRRGDDREETLAIKERREAGSICNKLIEKTEKVRDELRDYLSRLDVR